MKIIKREIESRLKKGESLRAIAATLGVSHQSLQYHRRRWNGKPLRVSGLKGKDHPSWRGGSFIDRWGYKMILCPERGKASKYVMEHVIVAEKMLKRKLRRNEIVHHVNGVKLHNDPANLLVVQRPRHRELHAQLEAIAMQLFRDGKISFSRQGGYRLIV